MLMNIVLANATEEFFVRKSPLYEVVGQLGMWGTIINGIQASALEHKQWKLSNWDGGVSMCYSSRSVNLASNTGR